MRRYRIAWVDERGYRWCSGHEEYLPEGQFYSPTDHYCAECRKYLALRSHRKAQRGERQPRPQVKWFSYT